MSGWRRRRGGRSDPGEEEVEEGRGAATAEAKAAEAILGRGEGGKEGREVAWRVVDGVKSRKRSGECEGEIG